MPDPIRTSYQEYAAAFYAGTVQVDMTPLYNRFLPLLVDGAAILDAGCGCGCGSDGAALAFAKLGYSVTAFDASPALVALAERHIGQPVHCLRFQDMTWRDAFDGIWACASLLYVPSVELPDVMGRLRAALMPGGIVYASFKYGSGEREHQGRRFTDLDEPRITVTIY